MLEHCQNTISKLKSICSSVRSQEIDKLVALDCGFATGKTVWLVADCFWGDFEEYGGVLW